MSLCWRQVSGPLARSQQQSHIHDPRGQGSHLQCCHESSPPRFSSLHPQNQELPKNRALGRGFRKVGTLQPQNKGEEPGEGTAMCPMDQARKGTARQPRIGEGRVSIEAAGHLGGGLGGCPECSGSSGKFPARTTRKCSASLSREKPASWGRSEGRQGAVCPLSSRLLDLLLRGATLAACYVISRRPRLAKAPSRHPIHASAKAPHYSQHEVSSRGGTGKRLTVGGQCHPVWGETQPGVWLPSSLWFPSSQSVKLGESQILLPRAAGRRW